MPAHTTAKSITPGSRVQSGPVNANYVALNTDMIAHIDGTDFRHPSGAIDVAIRPEIQNIANVADNLFNVLDVYAVLFSKVLGPWRDAGNTAGVGYAQRATNMGAALGSLYDLYTRLGVVETNGWVTSARIADGTIATGDLADGAITSAKIADLTIATGDIADGAITSAKIADATIQTADLADNSVTSAKLAPGAVTLSDIADGTITGVKIAADAIGAAQIAANAITASELADNAVDTAAIADGSVTTAKIGANQITSALIADGTIQTADIGAGQITSTLIADGTIATADLADGAVTSLKIADGTIATGDIADGAITSLKIADGTIATGDVADQAITTVKQADLSTTTAKIADGAVTAAKVAAGAIGTAALADYAVSAVKILDGAITPTGPLSMSVNILPLRKWNDAGTSVEYLGGVQDLTSYVPGAGLRRYVLLEVNSTGAAYVKAGDPTGGTAVRPTRDPDTTPLGFVYLEAGMTFIDASRIFPWRNFAGSGGGSGGGSPVGHVHGLGSEARVTALGLDEGFPRPTATPSMYIQVSGMRYRASTGQVNTWNGGLVGPFAVPGSGQRIDGVYLDPASGNPVIVSGTPDPTAPAKTAFTGDQRSVAYVHLRSTATFIGGSDDGVNGWIEDARDWHAGGGGANTINGVATGGTGVAAFSAGLVYSGGGATPLTSVAAPTGTVVGTSDAQTLTNKTISQAAAGSVGTIIRAAASPSSSLIQYQDSGSVVFGNVSQFKTFGFGAQETTGSNKVSIAGTVAGSASAKQAYGLNVAPTLQPFDNTASAIAVVAAGQYQAAGATGVNAYGAYASMARVGGDTGSFGTAASIFCVAPAFATTNLALWASGATQFDGNINHTTGTAVLQRSAIMATISAIAALSLAGNNQVGVAIAPNYTAPASGTAYGIQVTNVATVPASTAVSAVYGVYAAPTLSLGGGASVTNAYAIVAFAPTGATNNYAGFFSGNVTVTGAMSKGSGTFHIDHPLDPTNTDLYHGFVEAPFYDLLYSDTAALKDGKATVDIDAYARMRSGTFAALNGRVRVFTTNETGWTPVRGDVKGGTLTIQAQDATSADLVSWLVIGERIDPFVKSHLDPITDNQGRLRAEWPKPPSDPGTTGQDGRKGGYIHPEAWGKKSKPFIDADQVRRDNDRPARPER